MKKSIISAAIIIAVTSIFTVGCAKKTDSSIIEIGDKLFISQVNDILYLNPEDYFEKTIKYEGIFKTSESYLRDEPYCFVVRYGPGCCGFDGTVGFEVAWANDKAVPYPAVDSWVEATGVLRAYQEDLYEYLYLDLISLAVLDKRGAEFVQQ
jgi:uncharacterized membrane protein YcgQ (UPF0703/DUF1980 family)